MPEIENPYGPKSAELVALLDAIVAEWGLCEDIHRAKLESNTSGESRYSLANEFLMMLGTRVDESPEIEAFGEEIESKVTRVRRISSGPPTTNAVVNALDWYAVGTIIDVTSHQETYLLLTQPLQDFIAISKRTSWGTSLRELSLSMLSSLGGEEAVDAAARVLNG